MWPLADDEVLAVQARTIEAPPVAETPVGGCSVAVENVPVDVAPFVNRARLMGVAATDARRIPTASTYGTGSLVATRTPTLGRKLSPCRERAGPPRRAWPAASPRRLRGRATSNGDSELFGSPRAARRRHLRD